MKNVMHSAVRCLALAFSLLISVPLIAQESEYIQGYGCVTNADGSLDRDKSIRQAIENLHENAMEEAALLVSSHTVLRNNNGREDYHSVTAVDSGIKIPRNSITLIPYEGFWVARVERSKVFPQETKWVEEHNTYNQYPEQYTRVGRNGMVMKDTKRIRTREDALRGPSGQRQVINTRTTVTNVHDEWNGRYGANWEIPEEGGTGRAILGTIGLIGLGLLLFL